MIERRRAIMSDNIVPDDAIIIARRSANEKALMDVIYAQGWSESPSFMRQAEAEMVTSIGTAFYKNTEISDFTAFKYFTGVTALVNKAFIGCTNLQTIVLPDSLVTIGDAFENAQKLQEIIIPDSVTTLNGNYAFNRCYALKRMHIGKGLKTFSFAHYSNLGTEVLTVDPENPYFDSRDNSNALIRKSDNKLMLGCKTSFIPNSVKAVNSGAFRVRGITSVTFPEGFETADDYSFYESSSLTEITALGDKFMAGYQSFYGTGWHKALPNGAAYINKLFYWYKGAFADDGIFTIADGTVKLANECLRYCTYPKTLKKVIVPDSVTTVGGGMCRGTSVEVVDLGTGLTTIGDYAFRDCTNLHTLIIRAPRYVSWRYTTNTVPATTTLYVRDEFVNMYNGYTTLPLSQLPEELQR